MRGGGEAMRGSQVQVQGEVMNPGGIYVQTKYQCRHEGLDPF